MIHCGILHRAPSQVASYAHSFRRLISSNAKASSLAPSSTHCGEAAADGARLAGGEDDGREILQIDPVSKTIHTAVGSLPISPLMDPAFHGARGRFQQTKQPEARTQDKLKWRRALERNPYAQALATPLRRDPALQVALPRFFMQRFGLRRHPKTGEPWIIPLSLDPTEAVSGGLPSIEVAEDPTGNRGGHSATDLSVGVADPLASTAHPPEPPTGASAGEGAGAGAGAATESHGPSTYVLARQDLLRAFLDRKSSYSSTHRSLFRLSRSARLKAIASRAVWRQDMDAFVVELMRRRIAERLLYYARLVEVEKRGYLVPCGSFDDVQAFSHRGCLLWFGPVGMPETANPSENPAPAPPRLSTMRVEGAKLARKLAVHNLESLLGPEHLSRLRQGSDLFREGSLFLLCRKRTLDVQMKLWKLQGYMETA